MSELKSKDEEGLGIDPRMLYVAFDIPLNFPEELLKILPYLRPVWYECDGRKVFEVKDGPDSPVKYYRSYVLFTL